MATTVIDLAAPSGRAEVAEVLHLLGAIALISLTLVGRHWTDGAVSAPGRDNLEAPAYQMLFRDLSSPEQREYRQIQEGLTEAENVRSAQGAWPPPESLASQGIPPFAADPLGPKLRWSLQSVGTDSLYVGVPEAGGPAYLLVVQEPPAGTPGDPPGTPLDETHHRLASGVIFHVSTWEQPEGRVDMTSSVLDRPYLGGWKQILVNPPTLPPRL